MANGILMALSHLYFMHFCKNLNLQSVICHLFDMINGTAMNLIIKNGILCIHIEYLCLLFY